MWPFEMISATRRGKCRGHSRKNTVLWHILQTAGVSHILYRVGKILVPRIHFRALNFCPEHKSDLFFSFKDGKRSPARWEFHQKCKLLDYLRPSPQQTQAAMRFKNQAERRRFPMFWTEFVVEEHQRCKGGCLGVTSRPDFRRADVPEFET
jgi:hypothetical protein